MVVQVTPPPVDDDDRPLMTDEAGAYCRLSRAKMLRMRKAGTGPTFIRIDGRVLYLKPDLRKWLYANRTQK